MAWSAALAASLAIGVGVALARSERERRDEPTDDDPQPGRPPASSPPDPPGDHPSGGQPPGSQPPGSRPPSGTSSRPLTDDAFAPEPIDRTFGLLADERPADGLRRVALGQLDVAIELLGGSTDLGQAEAVHETRKAIKRLRATMRLLEGELGAGQVERERELLGEVARSLAGARDAEVMAQTLDDLMERHPRKLGRRRAIGELRERLERERIDATARTQADHAARAQALAELARLRRRVTAWQLRDRSAGKLAGPGLERIYRAGRSARARARTQGRGRARTQGRGGARTQGRGRGSGARAMHRWRKQVKDLRYALEAINVSQDARADGRSGGGLGAHAGRPSGGRVARLAKRADVLGEALGEEHDLMLLAELARAHEPLERRPRTRRRLLRAIAKRRAKLRGQALREGERLFGRKPKRFVRRVKAAS